MLPMRKLSTLRYAISSYDVNKKQIERIIQLSDYENYDLDFEEFGYEPPQSCVDAILNFASQFDVLKSGNVGTIELNLN
jgi:hypothetical protein